MNPTSCIATAEPRWKTYAKGGLFLSPALLVWSFASVFLFPKVLHVWQDLGIAASDAPGAGARWLVDAIAFAIRHSGLLLLVLVGWIALLEWASKSWALHRRTGVIVVVFVLNGAVLAGLAAMCVAALVPLPLLARAP